MAFVLSVFQQSSPSAQWLVVVRWVPLLESPTETKIEFARHTLPECEIIRQFTILTLLCQSNKILLTDIIFAATLASWAATHFSLSSIAMCRSLISFSDWVYKKISKLFVVTHVERNWAFWSNIFYFLSYDDSFHKFIWVYFHLKHMCFLNEIFVIFYQWLLCFAFFKHLFILLNSFLSLIKCIFSDFQLKKQN